MVQLERNSGSLVPVLIRGVNVSLRAAGPTAGVKYTALRVARPSGRLAVVVLLLARPARGANPSCTRTDLHRDPRRSEPGSCPRGPDPGPCSASIRTRSPSQ